MRYVGRYVFRVAISNKRIVSCENGRVVFSYDDKKNKTKVCSLDAHEFIRRFLQHVLPKGFVKVRHYGLLHHNARHSIEEVRLKVFVATGTETGETVDGAEAATSTHTLLRSASYGGQAVPLCPYCGRPMRFIAISRPPLKRSG